jgi:O-antigen ligase
MNRQTTLHRLALSATCLLPLFLFYGRAVADVLVCLADLLFLAHCALPGGGWAWLRRPWVAIAAVIWLWQLVASLVMGPPHSILEAAVMVRIPLFVAVLENWVLTTPRARQALWLVILLLAVWTGAECWQQYLTGANATGSHRWPDGSLTGPFYKPRAGEVFLFVALPGILPVVLNTLAKPSRAAKASGILLLLVTVTTMILIGQRMPNLLFFFGLCITGLLVKRFRLPLIAALGAGAVALALLPVISPPTFNKLVLHFIAQMSHFAASPYGQLYTRASVMIAAHPWLGFGFDGFKDFCSVPAYFHGWPALGIPNASNGGLQGCNLHPHNYYLQLGTMAGIPGLLLFAALAVLWLRRMALALRPGTDPVQAMLFVSACVIFWPLASTSSVFTYDTAGWVFMLTGWGLAASRGEGKQPLF